MNVPRRTTIFGIVVVAAIVLAAGLLYVVQLREPSAPAQPQNQLSTSTSQQSLQQARAPSTSTSASKIIQATYFTSVAATSSVGTAACTTEVPDLNEVPPPVTEKWISIHDPSLKYYLDFSQYTLQNGTICKLDSGNTNFSIAFAADPATFVVSTIDWADAKDKNHVYCNGQVLTGADPATFKVLSGSPVNDGSYERSFAKDKNHAYIDCALIADANAATFSLVGNPNIRDAYFAKDLNHVYFCGSDCNPPTSENDFEEIVGADPSTFELISNYIVAPDSQGSTPPSFYAQDINHIYQGAETMAGVNPKTTVLYCYDNSPDVGSTPYPLYCQPQ
jgi:hypothetical protein